MAGEPTGSGRFPLRKGDGIDEGNTFSPDHSNLSRRTAYGFQRLNERKICPDLSRRYIDDLSLSTHVHHQEFPGCEEPRTQDTFFQGDSRMPLARQEGRCDTLLRAITGKAWFQLLLYPAERIEDLIPVRRDFSGDDTSV